MINFGIAQGGNFQNALATGLQLGQMARARQDQKEQRNALAAFVTSPSDETAAAVAPHNPELAYRYKQDQMAAQAKKEEAQLIQAAMSEDPNTRQAAMRSLATQKFDVWKTLSAEQKEQAEKEAKLYASAALEVLAAPAGERSQRLLGYAQQLQSPEIAQIAQLPPEQQDAALRAAIAEGEMINELIAIERPQFMTVPMTDSLVNVKDPAAIAQIASERNQQASDFTDGTVIENDAGERMILRNGQWVPMGGAASNGSGGF